MPDEDIRTLYLKVLSTCMYGESNQKFIVCSGSGSNGKGMLHSLLSTMLGDYYYSLGSNILLEKKLKIGAIPELANINNKRAVVTTEPDAESELNCSLIKILTGDSQICARGLYKDDTKTNIKCTLIMECNDKPTLSENNLAMKRRLIDIPFKSAFYDDTMYKQFYKEGGTGVYTINTYYSTDDFRNEYKIPLFLILKEYICEFVNTDKKMFNLPAEVIERVDKYLLKSDNFLGWFNDNYTLTDDNTDVLKIQDLFKNLKNSEFYKNLDKKKRRELTKEKLIEIIKSKDYLKQNFKIDSNKTYILTNFKEIKEEITFQPTPKSEPQPIKESERRVMTIDHDNSDDDCYDEEEYDRIEEQKRQKKIKQLNGLDDGIPVNFN